MARGARLNTNPLSRGALRQAQFQIDQLRSLLAMEPDGSAEIRQLQRELSALEIRFEKIQFQQVKRLGFYVPRAPDGSELDFTDLGQLSRHQRYRFKQAAKRARHTIENNRIALIPARMGKADRAELKRQAKAAGAKTTDRAVFLPMPASERNRTVRGPDKLEYHARAKAWTLREQYQTSRGDQVDERYFLGGLDYIAETTERLDTLWNRTAYNPRTQRVVALYRGKQVGKDQYGSVQGLIDQLMKYDPGTQARIFDALQIMIVTKGRTPPKGGVPVRVLNPHTGRSRKPSAALVKHVAEVEQRRSQFNRGKKANARKRRKRGK